MFWNPFKAMSNLIAAIKANTEALKASTLASTEQTLALDQNSAICARTNMLLEKLLDSLRNLPDPGPISLTVTKENGTMLLFKINLPALPDDASDIVSGELKLKIGDADEQTIATTKEQTTVEGLSGDAGQTVNASFAYVDGAGNRSVHPSPLSVVLADTIPPPDAGVLGLEVTGQQ